MPGAGSAELAFGLETDYLGSVEDTDGTTGPDYYGYGRNPSVTGPTLDQGATRKRDARSTETQYSAEGNVRGSFSVDADAHAASFQKLLEWVFNGGGSFDGATPAQSARVYTASKTFDGTEVRTAVGAVPESLTLSWTQGEMVRYSLSTIYADEMSDVSEPSNITEASDQGEVPFHAAELSIDDVVQGLLQSFELEIANIAALRYGASRTAQDARIAAPEETLTMTAVFDDGANLDAAYGGSSQSSVADSLSSVPATIDLTTADGTDLATLNLSRLKPVNYSWEQLVGTEDTTESIEWHVNGVTVA